MQTNRVAQFCKRWISATVNLCNMCCRSIEKQTIAAVVYATHDNGMNKMDWDASLIRYFLIRLMLYRLKEAALHSLFIWVTMVMFSSNQDPRFFIRAILASPRQRLAIFTFIICCLVPIMMNSVLSSFKQSFSLIIQHPIASKQCSMELTASISEDVESALKRYNWVSLAYAWAWGRYSLMTSNHYSHRSWIVKGTSMILDGHHNLTGSSLRVSGRKKRFEIY